MSQDLKGSATLQITKGDINSLVYKQENISESLQPEIVKRAILHPIYNDDGELEERVYYSLHNDAARCTYISPHLRLEGNADEIIIAVPGNNDVEGEMPEDENGDIPDIPPFPPNPGPIYPSLSPVIPEDEEIDWPGGGGGGGGGSTGDDDDDDDGSSGPAVPRSDFDNYAALYVSEGNNRNITSVQDVTRFYQNRSAMTTAKNAMFETRRPFKAIGHVINDSYANLIHADDMYASACIEAVSISVPSLVNAPRMFKNDGALVEITLKRAKALKNAESMCENCNLLKTFILKDNHALSNAVAMFKNCKSLKYVDLGNSNGLTKIDHMFEGCNTPKINPSVIEVTESATYAFANTAYSTFKCDMPNVLDTSYMLYNCKNLTEFKNSNLPSTRKATGMLKNCVNLEKDSNLDYNSLTEANEMYSGCKKLTEVSANFVSLTTAKRFFKDCVSLRKIDFSTQFPVIVDAESMCEGCKNLDDAIVNSTTLVLADSMFKGCTTLWEVEINCPALTSAVEMFKGAAISTDVIFNAPAVDDFTSAFENTNKSSFGFSGNINPVTTVNMFKNSAVRYFENESNFERLLDANNMFDGCNKLVTIDLKESPLLTDIDGIFANCASLQEVTGSFPSVVAYSPDNRPFNNCPRIKIVNLTMANLADGTNMFRGCTLLTTVNSSFPNMVTATNMFRDCPNLRTPASTPKVESALGMYQNTAISTFPALPNLRNGRQTFWGCKNIVGEVSCSQWPNLENGINMFNGCNGITSVNLDFPANADIRNMFANCPNIQSVSAASFGEGVDAQSLMAQSCVDTQSFMNVYNAIKGANPVSDVNGCVCHVGVSGATIDELFTLYENDYDENNNPMFQQWEGNQYRLLLNANTNLFVMAVAN